MSCRTWSSAFLAKQDCNEGILKPHWVVTLEKQQSAIDIVICLLDLSLMIEFKTTEFQQGFSVVGGG